MIFSDKPKEECGIFGAFAPEQEAARTAFFALYSLQHRGQESAGIATSDLEDIHLLKGLGLVSQVFDELALESLGGSFVIGHTRYSTTGSNHEGNASPILQDCELGQFAVAHNGNLTNTFKLKQSLIKNFDFQTTTDSEILAKAIANAEGKTFEEKIANSMKVLEGAYSVVLLTYDSIYAFRDPHGVRPLSLAKLNGSYAIASETCAFGTIGAKRIRDIEPGEIIKINKEGLFSHQFPKKKKAFCIFEYIYFARPDSIINGQSVYSTRENSGRLLAKEQPQSADVVISIPESANPAAIGYSIESGIPYREGLIKNRYINRTFISPDQRLRERGIKLKLNALRTVIEGKSVVVVDDSLVRGNTTTQIVSLLREKGAKEVHIRIASPPMTNPCYLGVDTATETELIANSKSIEEIREHIGADSLGYLSLEGLIEATNLPKDEFCLACFNKEYPITLADVKGKFVLEKERVN